MKTFKAGEKVRIVKGNNGHFFEEGTIVTLCEDVTEDKDLFAAVNADGLRQVLEIEDIEPITSEFDLDDIEEFDFSELDDYDIDDDEIDEPSLDVPAFKVGDKVRVITDNPYYGWGNVSKGDVGTIIAIDGDVIRVNFPGQSRWNGRADEFELVKEEEVRFKVGDIVKGKSGVKRYRITDESMTRAEVIDVFEDRMIIRVLEHETHPNFVGEEFSVEMEYFELVEEAKIDTELVVRLIKSLTEEQKTMLRELLS